MKALFCAILALITLAAAPVSQAQQKIGVVNMTRVIQEFYKFKEATNQLQDDAAKAQKDINERLELRRKLTEEVNKLRGQIEDPIASADAKQKLSAQYQEKGQELMALERETLEFRNRRQRQITDQQNRLFSGIRDEVLELVKAKAARDQYAFVFENSTLGLTSVNGLVVPIVIHSGGGSDITDEIIVELNKDAPAAPAAPAAAPQ